MQYVRKLEDVPAFDPEMPDHIVQGTIRPLIDFGVNMYNFSLFCSKLQPGGYTTPHEHHQEHGYFYLSGEAMLHIGEEDHRVGPNTVVRIPPGTTHHQEVIGDKPLVLLEFFAPPVPPWSSRLKLNERAH